VRRTEHEGRALAALPGGYFLVHHLDVTVGEHPVRRVEIIGDPDAVVAGSSRELRDRWERRADARRDRYIDLRARAPSSRCATPPYPGDNGEQCRFRCEPT
jgi:hypothetical protein